MNTSQTAAEAVLHVSDAPEHLARATGAAKLLRQERPGTRVRIIVNGAALDGLVAGAEPLALDDGYTVEACETGMGRRGLDPAALQPGVGTVGSAVVALFDAQQHGASYIRIG